MAEPYNYTLANMPNPVGSINEGLVAASNFGEIRAKRLQAEQLQKQQEAAAQRQAAYHDELYEMRDNPSPSAISKLMLRYPEQAKALKEPYELLSKEQQQSKLQQANDVYMAALAGDTETAKGLLKQQAEAARNSGREADAKSAETIAQLLERDPNTAKGAMGQYLATVMGPEKYAETYGKLGQEARAQEKAPSELTESEAKASKAKSDAEKAAVAAKYAESEAVQDLEKKGWDIKKIANDIDVSKANVAIARANLALSREGNDLRRQEMALKVQDLQAKRDETIRAKQAEANEAISTLDGAKSLVDELLADSAGRWAATGVTAWSGSIPGSQARTYAGKVEQLANALALPNLGKLKGAISDKDIAFLKNIAANLDRYQGTKEFTKELVRVESILKKAYDNTYEKYGIPKPSAGAQEQVYEVEL